MVRWLDGQGVANAECTCKHNDGDGNGRGVTMILMIIMTIAMLLFPSQHCLVRWSDGLMVRVQLMRNVVASIAITRMIIAMDME